MKLLEDLVLTTTELSLLARMGAIDPLVAVIAPPLDDDAWEAIVGGLLARGLLVPDEGDGVRVAEEALPLLGVALLATSATRVARRTTTGEVAVTLLRADGAAVLHEVLPGGRCRLRPYDSDVFLEAAQDLLSLADLVSSTVTGSGLSSLDEFFDRLDAVETDESAFLRTIEVTDRAEAADPASSPRSRLAMLIQDGDGLWLAATTPGGEVTAEGVNANTARGALLALLEVAA